MDSARLAQWLESKNGQRAAELARELVKTLAVDNMMGATIYGVGVISQRKEPLSELQSRLAYEAKCIESDVSSRSVHAILLEASDEIGRQLLKLSRSQAALGEFVKAAKSWHNFHHGSKDIQCDWLCECIPAGEEALK